MANETPIQSLLAHPFTKILEEFFKRFPVRYCEEHIHLTGSLTAEFVWEKLQPLVEGPHAEIYRKKITEVYGPKSWPITNVADVDNLIRLKETEGFSTYLKILFLTKLIFTSRQAHADAAYSMAKNLYEKMYTLFQFQTVKRGW